jgi:WD40 repeat protein
MGERWTATKALRGQPHMELSNGVAASPDGRIAYVVSRDQSLRAFDLESGREVATGLAHVRGVKTVAVSESGTQIATGSYDRTVMLWSSADLSVRLPPVRLANSGISGVRCRGDRVFACSFDGLVFAIDGESGHVLWSRNASDASNDL